jgi:uncharacterized membrane protein YdjX (TVP38/TMEM64 family)
VSRRERGGGRTAALRLVLLAAVVGGLFASVALSGSLSSARVRDAVHGWGLLAPAAFVVVSAALTVACFPGPLLAGAAGLLFGTALGTPTAIIAATAGACAAFLVSRRVGGAAVERLGGRRLGALQERIAARGFLAVLYARILPALPYSLVNYAAGLTRVRLAVFAGATAIGCAPRAFAYAALGGSFHDFSSAPAIVALVVLVGMGTAGPLLAWRLRPAAPTPSGSGRGSSSRAGRSAVRP